MGVRFLTVRDVSYKYRKRDINITQGVKIHHVPPNTRMHHHFSGIPAKNLEPEPNHKKTLGKSKLRQILQNNWQNIRIL